jgi:hypothetical protein
MKRSDMGPLIAKATTHRGDFWSRGSGYVVDMTDAEHRAAKARRSRILVTSSLRALRPNHGQSGAECAFEADRCRICQLAPDKQSPRHGQNGTDVH